MNKVFNILIRQNCVGFFQPCLIVSWPARPFDSYSTDWLGLARLATDHFTSPQGTAAASCHPGPEIISGPSMSKILPQKVMARWQSLTGLWLVKRLKAHFTFINEHELKSGSGFK